MDRGKIEVDRAIKELRDTVNNIEKAEGGVCYGDLDDIITYILDKYRLLDYGEEVRELFNGYVKKVKDSIHYDYMKESIENEEKEIG